MKFFEMIRVKWKELSDKTKPFRNAMGKVGREIRKIWAQIYKFRDVVLALPVVIGSIWLACMNLSKLPDKVGINLQADGTFSATMGRGMAVFIPLVLTALCLVLMVFSKRKLYPWLISMLSLLLPLLILVTNVYPA